MNMNNGNMNNNNKNNENPYVRCVREHKFTFNEIHKAYMLCRKNKRNTANALLFEYNLESNLHELVKELNNKSYEPTRSVCFSIKDPKPREIFAADFRDRVVHFVLFNHLNPIFDKKFIYDSYASRKNKGTLKATKRTKTFSKRITNNSKEHAYYLQLDIHNFFMSVNKNILFSLIEKKVKDKNILWLCEKIIFHDPTTNYIQKGLDWKTVKVPPHKTLFNVSKNKGLPIGNLTSQFFANVYLNELDQFVKHKLKIKYYLRYVDDFVIFSKSREELLRCKEEIENFLEKNLSLKLKPLVILKPVSSGINFVGYVIKPNYFIARNRVVNNIYKKINKFKDLSIYKKDNILVYDFKHTEEFIRSFNSYLGYLKPTKHFNVIKNIKDKNPYLETFFKFEKNKIKNKFENKITFFQDQNNFFKKENDLVFLDVSRYYRILGEDAIFLAKKLKFSLKKTNNYFYLDISKKNLFNLFNYFPNKKILLTKQIAYNKRYLREANMICFS